jgi:dipeptidyl aminopeptidase/acylaminoacyl peptidase
LIGVHFSVDGGGVYYLDDRVAAIQKSLQASFPKNRVSIVSQSNEGHAIIEVGSDQSPGRYFLFTDATHTLESIGDRAPWIDPAQMATQRPVKINTRDNLALRGYLNMPRTREAHKLPLVVIPTGGPDGHDAGGWSPAAQFLASRGYAVLRLNLRGSSGYGRTYHATGQHRELAEVRNDVADGIAWAVGEGIADNARVAIFGSNFGGYVALMSMAANPDAFRCGISYGGEVNLEHLFSRRVITANYYTERTSRQFELWDDVVGNHRDTASLRAQSPLYNAAKIRMPVLLAYSEDDTVMPFSDAREMRDALKDAGNVEFMSKPNEPHLFENTANKIELYTRIEAFLQKCNPAE